MSEQYLIVDINVLPQLVEEEGGMEHITKERKWSRIASKLGFPTAKGQGSTIKTHYERLLYPFYLFKKGQTIITEVGSVVSGSSSLADLGVQKN